MLRSLLAMLLIFNLSAKVFAYEVEVIGGDEDSFKPIDDLSDPWRDTNKWDVIIVGGGLAGLSAAFYLTKQGQKVLLLEKEKHLGGLASSGSTSDKIKVKPKTEKKVINFDRGAAYFTDTYPEELKILTDIGLGDFKKNNAIHEPIDSYLWNGVLYPGIWDESLEHLPASFALFKYALKDANNRGWIPNQPFEEAANNLLKKAAKVQDQLSRVSNQQSRKALELKKMIQDLIAQANGILQIEAIDAATWIRSMPQSVSLEKSKEGQEIYNNFSKDSRINREDPMSDVIDLLNLYCRSALGRTCEQISAVAFANFYISEIETRYTSPEGTGIAARLMVEKLQRYNEKKARLMASAPVLNLANTENGVSAVYYYQGKKRISFAKFAVFATQVNGAPKLIQDFAAKDPVRAAVIKKMNYANYSVHSVFTEGHPYRASYDTWVKSADSTAEDFTDLIIGRWMDPNIKGYAGMRDFKKNPVDENGQSDEDGILTIYHPLPPSTVGGGYSNETAIKFARLGVERMLQLFSPLLAKNWGTEIKIKKVETSRWPFSVHVPGPRYFTDVVPILKKPFGNIFFANNNLGTPAFEEALFRGHCAADNVLKALNKGFQFESWTDCPLEMR